MKVTIIVAIAKNNVIGKDNNLIWHLPADLKRFKRVTTGHTIIMGRNTFESIGKPLPNRRSIVISRKKDYTIDGCEVVNSIKSALDLVSKEQDVFIIGGSQIYKKVLELDVVDKLDVTIVHKEFEGDVFFPKIDNELWEEISREDFTADEKNKYDYSFVSFVRKRN